MALRRLIYFSKPSEAMTQGAVANILDTARRENASYGITGLLLHVEGVFAQVLEGPEEAVRQLFTNIEKDNRHSDVFVMADDPISQRNFSDWSMAYLHADKRDLIEAAGIGSMDEILSHMLQEGDVDGAVVEAALQGFAERLRGHEEPMRARA